MQSINIFEYFSPILKILSALLELEEVDDFIALSINEECGLDISKCSEGYEVDEIVKNWLTKYHYNAKILGIICGTI